MVFPVSTQESVLGLALAAATLPAIGFFASFGFVTTLGASLNSDTLDLSSLLAGGKAENCLARQAAAGRKAASCCCGDTATAEMITMAWASGKSSVIERSICAMCPTGVIAFRRASAPPVSSRLGLPPGWLITPISLQNTPFRNPVPRALAQASLAAKRFA